MAVFSGKRQALASQDATLAVISFLVRPGRMSISEVGPVAKMFENHRFNH